MKKFSLFTLMLFAFANGCLANNYIFDHQSSKDTTLATLEIVINELDTCLIQTNANCQSIQTFSAHLKNNESDTLPFNWSIEIEGNLLATGEGKEFDFEIELNRSYLVTFSVNQCIQSATFIFTDCQAPSFELLSNVYVEFVPPDGLYFYPQQVIASAQDNCSDSIDLSFRVWYQHPSNPLPTNLADVQALPTFIISDSELSSYFPDTQQVIIYAIDEVGNYFYDSTDIIIYCNDPCTDAAPNTVSIKGEVISTNGATMEAVEINTTRGTDEIIYTDEDGHFSFYTEFYNAFDVIPTKSNEPINGVTVFDLLLIKKHILGITPFNTPYQFLAADVDFSGTITTFDILTLRKLILNIDNNFPIGESWLFIPADYKFLTSNPINEAYPTSLKVESMYYSRPLTIDFIGIKLGDVNSSVIIDK